MRLSLVRNCWSLMCLCLVRIFSYMMNCHCAVSMIDYLFVGTTQGSLLDVGSKCSRPSGDPWMRVSIVSFVVCWCIHCISPCPFFFWDDTYKIIVYTYSVGCYSAWHDIINSAGYSIKAENAYLTGASGLCSKFLMESVFVLFVSVFLT